MTTDGSPSQRKHSGPHRALEHQWSIIEPVAISARQPELDLVLQMISRPGSIGEVVAHPGMGKTTMLKMASEMHCQQFGGVVEFVAGWDGLRAEDLVDVLADRFRAARGPSLLVIDDAQFAPTDQIWSLINGLETGPWSFSTLIGSREPTGLGERITLLPFAYVGIETLLAEAFGAQPSPADVERLMRASQGVPVFAKVLIDQLKTGLSLAEVERLVSPWRSSGLLGPDGLPMDGRDPRGRRLFSDIRLINSDLVERVNQDSHIAYDLTSRQFEELTADLLERMGYEVQLTAKTRDGGKDLYALRKDGLGAFMFVVECKRYSPNNHVGVGVVRSLHGVAQHERANGAIVMTTSFFTEPAKQFARDLKGQVSLKDFVDLQTWLREVSQPK